MSKSKTQLTTIIHTKALQLMIQQDTRNLNTVDENGIETATIQTSDADGFELKIENYDPKGISAGAYQLLDVILIEYSSQKPQNMKVRIPVRRLAELRQISENYVYEQVPKQMRELAKIGYSCRVKWGNKMRDLGFIKLSGGTGIIKDGIVEFNINQDFQEALNHMSPQDYNLRALTVDTKKNPHTYYLVKRIDWHYAMNLGDPGQNTISVRTLKKACPHLPFEADIRDKAERDLKKLGKTVSPKYAESIMHPFLRDLARCRLDFTLTDKYKKALLTCENGIIPKVRIKYEDFREGYVIFNFSEYPDHVEAIENKAARRQKKRLRQLDKLSGKKK